MRHLRLDQRVQLTVASGNNKIGEITVATAIKLRNVRGGAIANNRFFGFDTPIDAEVCEDLAVFGNVATAPRADLEKIHTLIRKEYGIGATLSDAQILEGLRAIAAASTKQERADALAKTTLGRWLIDHGVELVSAVVGIAALLASLR